MEFDRHDAALERAKVLITGGAGFIGSHLTDRLIAGGHEVVVLDDLSGGSLLNLGRHKHAEGYDWSAAASWTRIWSSGAWSRPTSAFTSPRLSGSSASSTRPWRR